MITRLDLRHFKCFRELKLPPWLVDAAFRYQCLWKVVGVAGLGAAATNDGASTSGRSVWC